MISFLIVQGIFGLFLLIAAVLFVFLYRFYFFFRDPKRSIPGGNNIVAPADGYIMYIKELSGKEIPFSVKKGKKIYLDELIKTEQEYQLLIGIFMTPLSVHYNRFPVSGTIKDMYYKPSSRNLMMTKGFLNILYDIKPYTDGAEYIVENERNITILENSHVDCAIVQIADQWVKKIVNQVKVSDSVNKGDKLGLIRMGSQCDLFLRIKGKYQIVVKERDYVKAGSSILIHLID